MNRGGERERTGERERERERERKKERKKGCKICTHNSYFTHLI